jgi:PPK2 family polyphosphate:nucleotide phosphotransferase
MRLATRVETGKRVHLARIDPDYTANLSKGEAARRMEDVGADLDELQELLYAAATHSVLIILQGMDTSGKDGVIRHVLGHVNPQGCRVESFKAPTEEELGHDFLWRVHRVTPRRGITGVFNRSHYEDVLIARVGKLVPEEVWSQRYEHINNFEAMLSFSNTIIVKFFLYISKDEQRERLLEREQDTTKSWKLSIGDWEQRHLWSDYIKAYDDVLERCSTEAAPWYIVPANKKWFRNLAVASVLVDTLKPYRKQWENTLKLQSHDRLEEIHQYRAEHKINGAEATGKKKGR